MVQPGAEDAGAAQLAAVLVRHDVVGIVGAGAEVAEVTGRPAFGKPAGDDPIVAVGLAAARAARAETSRRCHLPALAVQRVPHRGLRRHHDWSGIELGDIDIDDVVAERVIEGGADDLGASGQLRVRVRVDFDLIQVARSCRSSGSRAEARALAAGDDPSVERQRRRVSGPRTSSSSDIGRRPMRLVNQLESGTSSTVFTFSARTCAARRA